MMGVTVVLTLAEAERLYASAAFYEADVSRVVNVEATKALADSALTKLAAAIAEAGR